MSDNPCLWLMVWDAMKPLTLDQRREALAQLEDAITRWRRDIEDRIAQDDEAQAKEAEDDGC